jgi:hypothetical protein
MRGCKDQCSRQVISDGCVYEVDGCLYGVIGDGCLYEIDRWGKRREA